MIAILAGGESRRMGRDKAVLVLESEGGITLLERLARAALAAAPAEAVRIVGRARPEGWPLAAVRFVEDETPGAGPLGGLATALRQADGADTLLVACDMPRIDAGALRWLLDQGAWHQPLGDGLAVQNGAQVEPLFSIYTAACLALVERRLAAGRRSMIGLIETGRFARLAAPPEIAAALANVNTPEEWAALDQ